MFKGRVALEVEWNNKDPFYDRDLNNFRLLFDLRVIEVGVIVTRATELQSLFVEVGRDKSSYGASTTHLDKLLPRMEGGWGRRLPGGRLRHQALGLPRRPPRLGRSRPC